MKITVLILSAIAVSGTALLIAQEDDKKGDRPAPRGERRGRGMFANAPLFKALGINEKGEIVLPKADDDKAKADLVANIIACDTDKDGKLSRTEMFGEFRRRGGGGGGGGGGDRRRGGEGGSDRPKSSGAE